MPFEHELKNAYIGEYWSPNANTIAYFPFEEDQLDHSWNWLTINNTLTKETIGYSLTQAMSNTFVANSTFIKFVWCWYIVNSINSSSYALGILWTTNLGGSVYYAWNPTSSQRNKILTYQWSNFSVVWNTDWMSYYNWHYLAFSFYNWVLYVCKDWVVTVQYNWTPYDYWDCNIGLMQKWSWVNFKITYSNLIAESEWWSEEEIVNYYNKTKSTYWL